MFYMHIIEVKKKICKITEFEKILKILLLVLQNLDSREMHISTYVHINEIWPDKKGGLK